MSEKITADLIKSYLGDCDRNIVVYDKIDSTNTEAKRLAEADAENTVIIAAEQTAGRGRMGRQFYSPRNRGIYMSFLLRNTYPSQQLVLITTAVSVAVCRAIGAVTGMNPKIKWVNDLYLNQKKVCGILAEAVNDCHSGAIKYIVVGIGINCGEADFPVELCDIATSLGDVDRSRLAAEIIRETDRLGEMISKRDFIAEYKEKSLVIGKKIKVLNTDEIVEAVDIDDFGGLVIRMDDGTEKTLSSGEISIRVCGNNNL